MHNPSQTGSNQPTLSPEAVNALLASATWARMLGLLGIIGSVIVLGMTASKFGKYDSIEGYAIFAIVFGIIVLLPSFLLFRYAGKAKVAAIGGRTDQFDEAFNALKGFLVICSMVGLLLILAYIVLSNIGWSKG
jgi:Na+/melibiose symporter-like transporter